MKPRFLATAVIGIVAVSLTACVPSQRDESSSAEASTFVFGAPGAPKLFDPFYASDGETFRITNQMYDGLLTFEPGTAALAPALATEWEHSADGLEWTFTLRDDVTFHDGTEFNADAVCFNFNRWYNQTGAAQSSGVSYSWNNDFGGFADGEKPSLFESCEATEEFVATITLTRTTSRFPATLTHSTYAMSSPTALEAYDADAVTATGSGFTFPEYAMAHPTGTGAFTFVSYDDANGTVTLERNESYWGETPGVEKLIFRIIPDEATRRQELEAGSIDGYDLPNPVDWNSLSEAGFEIGIRPPFSMLFVGLNASQIPELKDVRVRQALMYALNREQLVDTQFPEGTIEATQFMPPGTIGFNDDIVSYPYDPAKAKALLADAGQENLEIELWAPTEVSRPYMPDPQRVAEAIRTDWEAVGVTVNLVRKPWTGGYLEGHQNGEAPTYLLGGTPHYDSADNMLATHFGATDTPHKTEAYDFGETLASDLKAADSEVDEQVREGLYKELNRQIVEDYLPALPVAFAPSGFVISPEFSGLTPSPVSHEVFAEISKKTK